METANSFGYWVRRQRKARDLTQRALAERVGCSLAAIKKIEQDERRPSRQIAELLADILGVLGDQREIFLEVARGLRSVDQLSLVHEPSISVSTLLQKQESIPHNLPIQLTSFVGREKEIVEIIRLLEKARLVTLIGPGGTGKTRLSIQVANQLLDQYPDGVWMVELAPILNPLLIPRTTAIAIGLRDEPHRPVIDMLCDYLHAKKMLIILDNCEHLIEACAQMADTLLHACPYVRILATSREALSIAGETSYLVPSLTLPDIQHLPPIESLDQFEAIKLFLDRAASAIPTFLLTDENASAVAQICSRLDGIPLAIELAAGKIRAMSTRQLAGRLNDRFHLLTGGSRTALPRHQTLQAAIEWSYNLLPPVEQILFRRLSVFVGGWTLEAAESVCSDQDTTTKDALKPDDILELLTQLINKSLVTIEDQNGEVRYHMLETIRQFGNDKLQEANESESLRDRHLEYFLLLAETAAPHLIRPEQVEWLARLEVEYENIRAVLGWALRKEQPEYALRFAAALGQFWHLHSYWLEGTKWLETVLAKAAQDLTPVEKIAYARALYRDANIALEMNNTQRALASARASLTLCEAGTNRLDLGIARFQLGWAFTKLEEYKYARPLLEQSLTDFRELQDVFWEAIAYHWLSHILIIQGEKPPGEIYAQYLELARRVGERLILAIALSDLADWEWRNQQFDEAEALLREYAMIRDELGYKAHPVFLLQGLMAHCRNDFEHAKLMYTKYKEQSELMGDRGRKSSALQNLGILERDEGNFHKALYNFEEALKIAQEIGTRSRIGFWLALLSQSKSLLGDLEGSKRNSKEGLVIVKEVKGRYSKSNPLLIFSNTYANLQPQIAVQLLGAVHSYYKNNIHEPIDPLMTRESDSASAQARQNLGESIFNAAWAEGEKLTLNEAIDLALKTLDEM